MEIGLCQNRPSDGRAFYFFSLREIPEHRNCLFLGNFVVKLQSKICFTKHEVGYMNFSFCLGYGIESLYRFFDLFLGFAYEQAQEDRSIQAGGFF